MGLAVAGCASAPPAPEPKLAAVSTEATVLEHLYSLTSVGLGSGDAFKRTLVGSDQYAFERPVALAVRDHIMYIADAGADAIFKYDFKVGRLVKLYGAGERLAGDAGDIYIDPDFSFYVADPLGRQVLHFSPNGRFLRAYSDAPNISRPIAVTVDQARNEVLVADELYSHIVVFDRDTGKALYGIGRRGNGPGKFRVITDMVVHDDKLYIADRVELRLQVLNREDGRFLASFGQDHLIFPQALAVADDGRVFVADRSENNIKVFSPKGELMTVIGRNGSAAGEFRIVTALASARGRLYAADSLNQRIQVFRVLPPKAVASTD